MPRQVAFFLAQTFEPSPWSLPMASALASRKIAAYLEETPP